MVKHIVMWKFKKGEEENMRRFLDGLSSLYGRIDELRSLEIGVSDVGGQYDAVMISDFRSYEELEAYKNNPLHREVSSLCKSIRTDRASIDYEF